MEENIAESIIIRASKRRIHTGGCMEYRVCARPSEMKRVKGPPIVSKEKNNVKNSLIL